MVRAAHDPLQLRGKAARGRHRPRTMTGNPELDAIFAEIDAAAEAYSRSIDQGLALAAEMRQLADAADAGMADARAELAEWF